MAQFYEAMQAIIIAQSFERIFRRVTQRFGSFPIKMSSNRIPTDMNALTTYEDIFHRAFNVYKTCT